MKRVREPVRVALLCALLFVATLALYRPALGFGFVDYDDPDFVTDNRHVLGGLSSANIFWAFTSGGNAANWQPLTWLSLMLDTSLWGENPVGFHLTNILWHSANAALAFLLLWELTGATWLSVWAAALFAWHPLRVESVAWISERKDVMSVFFGLLALWVYARDLKRRSHATGPFARAWYFVAFGAFGLGLLCKPMLVTLPVVMLLIYFGWRKENAAAVIPASTAPARRAVLELLPFAGLAALSAGITFHLQREGGATNDGFTVGHRIANALLSIMRYGTDFIWPSDLAVGYAHEHSISTGAVLGAFVVLTLLTVLAFRIASRRPWARAGWCWFLIMLVPVLGLIQVGAQARADRYTYLPSLGLELAVIAALLTVPAWPAMRRAGIIIGVVTLGFACVRTRQQLPVWANSTTLFEHALDVAPDNYIALSCRAATLLNSGRTADAARYAARALQIKPDYVPALLTAGAIEEAAGRTDVAMTRYREALRHSPRYAPVHERLGTVLLHERKFTEALDEFDRAVQIRDDAATAELGRALALTHLQRPDEAGRAFARAVAIRPNYPEALAGYASFLDGRGEVAAAWPRYQMALHFRPRYAEAHYNYANSLLQNGQPARAIDHYRAAVALQPADPDARYGLGVALEQAGRNDDAIAAYEATLRLEAGHAEAHYSLAALLLAREEMVQAGAHFRAAAAAQPTFGEAFVGLGITEASEGKLLEAIRDGRTAVDLMPGNGSAHYWLGQSLQRAGRLAEAAREWREALRLTPELPGLKEQLAAMEKKSPP